MLAFDFGTRRIGVAVGELSVGIASPLATVAAEPVAERFARIAALVSEWRPAILVVGIPRHLDGRAHEFAARCERFARQLEGRFGLPVVRVDERLTSAAAAMRLEDLALGRGKTTAVLDRVAAQEILESFFEEHSHAAA